MDCNGLRKTYWEAQIDRVRKMREKISSGIGASAGRIIPEDEDLALGEGRRLELAVMFLDISDFSSRPMETAAEQDMMLRVLNLFFTEMFKIAEDYGGTVEKNTGDGLMAYFENDPLPDGENASKKAVACALTMLKANMHLISPILRATPVPEIEFRVSIDHGLVTIARMGSAKRFNANAAIGATANFASKMLRYAKPGDVVIGESVKNQLPQEWQNRWTELATLETGWVYMATQRTYPLYRFFGHWNQLVGA